SRPAGDGRVHVAVEGRTGPGCLPLVEPARLAAHASRSRRGRRRLRPYHACSLGRRLCHGHSHVVTVGGSLQTGSTPWHRTPVRMTNVGAAVDPGEGPQRLMVMNGFFRRQDVVRPKRHRPWFLALVGACILLMSLALAACGSATSARSVSPGFTGYVWQLVAISHGGKVTSIPARLQ